MANPPLHESQSATARNRSRGNLQNGMCHNALTSNSQTTRCSRMDAAALASLPVRYVLGGKRRREVAEILRYVVIPLHVFPRQRALTAHHHTQHHNQGNKFNDT